MHESDEIYVSKNWVNFKVLCGWSGCGHPACVRLKVAEIAGLGVGREREEWRETQAEHSLEAILLCLPSGQALPFLCLSFQKEPSQGVRAWSAGQEGPGALSVRTSTWHVGTTGVGQTVGVASRSHSEEAHTGTGISVQWEGSWPWGVCIPRVLGLQLTL